ncbi:MAG: MBL fold metallo-hydrolase [Promethearchaeia archaeon]
MNINEKIIIDQGKVNDFIHLVDLHGFGGRRILSGYIAEFDDCSVIMDCGSSLNVKWMLKYLKKHNISKTSIKYLLTSHHHFDHNGGMWKLYEEIKKENPEVKILTNQKTMELLNDFEEHLSRGKRTYGNLIGVMKPIEEDAFKIIEPSNKFGKDINNLEIHETFESKGSKIRMSVLKTPGHTPDHQSILFVRNGIQEFIFFGEAIGTLYHSSKLVTTPTSMPIYFNFKEYMNSVENLRKLNPKQAGFGHYGVVNGENNVQKIMEEHKNFMNEFRELIIKYYNEKPETKYIVEKITPYLTKRTDIKSEFSEVFRNIVLGVVYGMMVDLGYRKA